jgi:serine/threonine-protein kinase
VLIDAKTQVNLTVSSGPGPVAQTRAIQFQLPVEQDFYKVAIRLTDVRGEREIYNKLHSAGEQVNVAVSYVGNATVNIQLNGKPYDSYKL